MTVPDQGATFSDEAQKVRWFLLPTEAQKQLSGSTWSKLKKASGDKLNIKASSGEVSPAPLQKPKKSKADKKEQKSVDVMEVENEVTSNDCHNPFGSLAGDAILPIPTLGHDTRRRRSKAAWLTRQATEESDIGRYDLRCENDMCGLNINISCPIIYRLLTLYIVFQWRLTYNCR